MTGHKTGEDNKTIGEVQRDRSLTQRKQFVTFAPIISQVQLPKAIKLQNYVP